MKYLCNRQDLAVVRTNSTDRVFIGINDPDDLEN